MANINFVNQLSSPSVRVINEADVINEAVVLPGTTHPGLRLDPEDSLIIEILGGVALPRGCFIELNEGFAYEFSVRPATLEDTVNGSIRTLRIPDPQTPNWDLTITNPDGVSIRYPIHEENVTVGENQI